MLGQYARNRKRYAELLFGRYNEVDIDIPVIDASPEDVTLISAWPVTKRMCVRLVVRKYIELHFGGLGLYVVGAVAEMA